MYTFNKAPWEKKQHIPLLFRIFRIAVQYPHRCVSLFTFTASFNTSKSTYGPHHCGSSGNTLGGHGFDRRVRLIQRHLKVRVKTRASTGQGVRTASLVHQECYNFMPLLAASQMCGGKKSGYGLSAKAEQTT